MTFKEFGEQSETLYILTVSVNDEDCTTINCYSEESLLEQLRKADQAIAEKLKEQYENLPEPIEDESRGLSQ